MNTLKLPVSSLTQVGGIRLRQELGRPVGYYTAAMARGFASWFRKPVIAKRRFGGSTPSAVATRESGPCFSPPLSILPGRDLYFARAPTYDFPDRKLHIAA